MHAKNSQIHKFSQAYHGWPRSVVLVLLLLPPGSLALPPWSWDTMQTYIHCANMSGPWNDECN